MDKEEVDGKVRELSRSGSNPAMRGVLFANMYHKIGCYEEAIEWVEKFLQMRPRDAEAFCLLGDAHFERKDFAKALESYKRSLEVRPRQPGLSLKVAELLVRYEETKNLESAAIWIRKAEQINQGHIELYHIRKDYLEAKGGFGSGEMENLIKSQIKLCPRVASLYVDLVRFYKGQSQSAAVPIESTINQMEQSRTGRQVLLNSIEWLQETSRHGGNMIHRLNKIIFLCNLKLHKRDLTPKDVLELDHFLSDFGQDLDLKRESGRLLLYFVSHLANVSDSDRDILLLLSAVSTFSADETRNLDSSHLSRIFAARSACSATFLRGKEVSTLRQSVKSSLGGAEQRARFARRLLPAAKHLPLLLTPMTDDEADELDATNANLVELIVNCGTNLDLLVWLLKANHNLVSLVLPKLVKHIFPTLPENSIDPSQLSRVDLEAFLVALLCNVSSTIHDELPALVEVVSRVDQRTFWKAAVMLHNNEAIKSNQSMLRKTVKSGKNVIRLNGTQPAVEIVAEIGQYLCDTGRFDQSVRYLESVEHLLSAAVRGKSLVVGSSGSVTLLGSSASQISAAGATSYLATLAFANGHKAAEEGNVPEAVAYYETASTAESLLAAATLLKDAETTEPNTMERAIELCARARTCKPKEETSLMLEELEGEISQIALEKTESDTVEEAANGTNGTNGNSTLNNSAGSIYSTPLVKNISRRRISEQTKQFQELSESVQKMAQEHRKSIELQNELQKNVQSNSDNIRQLTMLLSNLLHLQPVMMAPPAVVPQMVPPGSEQLIGPAAAALAAQSMAGMPHVPPPMGNPMMGMPRGIGMAPQVAARPMVPPQMAPPQMPPTQMTRAAFTGLPQPAAPPMAAPVMHQAAPPSGLPKPVETAKAPETAEPVKSDQPRFVFKPKEPAKPAAATAAKPAANSGFFSSTPAHQKTHKFVFKSPQQADVENAKLDEDEKNAEENEGDVGPHFEPVIPLPELVEVKTGEEDEDVEFCARGKLYRWVKTEWKERGLGEMKILKNGATGRHRVLMRREQVLKICANHLITGEMKLAPMADKPAWIWHAMDASPEEANEGEIVMEQFAIRFKTPEIAADFKKVFDVGVAAAKPKSQAVESKPTPSIAQPTFGAPTPSAAAPTPAIKTEVRSPPKPSGKFDFNFGGQAAAPKAGAPFAFKFTPSTPTQAPVAAKEETEAADDPPEGDADPYFEPVVHLEEVEVKSGEEDESVKFAHRAKLYRYDGEWKERGLGDIKILQHNATKKSRILMRREQVMKIAANHLILPEMNLSKMDGKDTTRIWIAMDCSMEEDDPTAVHKFCVRFKTAEVAEQFEVAFNAAKSNSSPIPAVKSTPPPSKPEIKTVTVSPVKNLASIFSKKPEEIAPEPVQEAPKEEPKKNLFGGLASAMKSSGFGQTSASPFEFKFGQSATSESTTKPAGSTFSFGTSSGQSAPSSGGFGGLKPSGANLGFGGLAATQESGNGNAFSAGSKPFDFAGKGNMLFGAAAAENAPDNDGDGEDGAQEPHFEPIIALPDLVAVKTGEEGLEELFRSRAKLFRWAETEWKERGLGDIKIYRDPANQNGRVIMRREQVHKLACNHYVTCGMTLAPTNNSDRSWTWGPAQDWADGEVKSETFAVKFKTPELAKEFESVFYAVRDGTTSGGAAAGIVTPPPEESPEPVKKPAPEEIPVAKPTFGFGQPSKPPANESPAEMAARLDREKLAAELAAAAATNKFSFGISAGQSAPSTTTSAPVIFGGGKGTGFGASSTGFGQGSSAPSGGFSFGTGAKQAGGSGFSFGVSASGAGSAGATGKSDFSHLGFGVKEDESDADSDELYGENSEAESDEYEDGEVTDDDEAVDQSAAEESDDDVIFVKVSSNLPDAELVKKAKELGLPATFYNYLECPELDSDGETFPWERKGIKVEATETAEPEQKPAPGGFSFGFGSPSKSTFGSLASSGQKNAGFGGFGASNGSADGAFGGGFGGFKNAGKQLFGAAAEQPAESVGEDECNATFKPVLEELPPEIEVQTGLENETEIFSHRAKLFRFARECSPPEWKERGLGDIKIVQNTETQRFRVVMRREQVLKICANHYINAEMTLAPNNNSDRAWIWTALDYGDPNEPVGEVQQFCVRFKNAEIAAEFRAKFEESQAKLLDKPISTPDRKASERISQLRNEQSSASTDKMRDELLFFKEKFKNGEGLAPGVTGEKGSLTPHVKLHREKLNAEEGTIPKPNLNDTVESNQAEEEANVDFKPVLEKLPDLVAEKTGEEDEIVKFCCRSKLYIWKDEQWKERGLGNCRILQDGNNFLSRIVMRREQVKKVCLNMPLRAQCPAAVAKKDSEGRAITFGGIDFSDMESDQLNTSTNGEFQKFCLRFKTSELATMFARAYATGVAEEKCESEEVYIQPEEAVKAPTSPEPTDPQSPEHVQSPPKATFSFGEPTKQLPSFGGFTFDKESSSGGFNFGGAPAGPNNGGFNLFNKPPAGGNPFSFNPPK